VGSVKKFSALIYKYSTHFYLNFNKRNVTESNYRGFEHSGGIVVRKGDFVGVQYEEILANVE
jgi:hypothetical protein